MSTDDDQGKLGDLSLLMCQIYAIAELIQQSELTQPVAIPSALAGGIDAIHDIALRGYRVAFGQDPV